MVVIGEEEQAHKLFLGGLPQPLTLSQASPLTEEMKTKRLRRSFTDDFKAEAVKWVLDGVKAVAQVARDREMVLHRHRSLEEHEQTPHILVDFEPVSVEHQ